MYKGAKQDYQRLREYAKELGYKVRVVKKLTDFGTFDSEKQLITVERSSYAHMVVVLLHELGHARDFLAMGGKNRKNADRARQKSLKEMSVNDRWAVYVDECHGIAWMGKIAKLLKLNIPYQLVCVEQEYDRLVYRTWAERGDDMSEEEKQHHRDFLRKIWLV